MIWVWAVIIYLFVGLCLANHDRNKLNDRVNELERKLTLDIKQEVWRT